MNRLYVAILFDYILSINDNFWGGKELWWYGLSEWEKSIIFQIPADDGTFYVESYQDASTAPCLVYWLILYYNSHVFYMWSKYITEH